MAADDESHYPDRMAITAQAAAPSPLRSAFGHLRTIAAVALGLTAAWSIGPYVSDAVSADPLRRADGLVSLDQTLINAMIALCAVMAVARRLAPWMAGTALLVGAWVYDRQVLIGDDGLHGLIGGAGLYPSAFAGAGSDFVNPQYGMLVAAVAVLALLVGRTSLPRGLSMDRFLVLLASGFVVLTTLIFHYAAITETREFNEEAMGFAHFLTTLPEPERGAACARAEIVCATATDGWQPLGFEVLDVQIASVLENARAGADPDYVYAWPGAASFVDKRLRSFVVAVAAVPGGHAVAVDLVSPARWNDAVRARYAFKAIAAHLVWFGLPFVVALAHAAMFRRRSERRARTAGLT